MGNENLSDILEDAYQLYQDGSYPLSLEKYIFVFDSIHELDSPYIGAKYRSLHELESLAKVYPPAYNALLDRQKKALRVFEEDKDQMALIDYARISVSINRDQEFIDLFSSVYREHKEIAQAVYLAIENILIKNGALEICNDLLVDSFERYQFIMAKYNELIQISNESFQGGHDTYYTHVLEEDIRSLVLILKIGKRESEIEKILTQLKLDIGNKLDIKIDE